MVVLCGLDSKGLGPGLQETLSTTTILPGLLINQMKEIAKLHVHCLVLLDGATTSAQKVFTSSVLMVI